MDITYQRLHFVGPLGPTKIAPRGLQWWRAWKGIKEKRRQIEMNTRQKCRESSQGRFLFTLAALAVMACVPADAVQPGRVCSGALERVHAEGAWMDGVRIPAADAPPAVDAAHAGAGRNLLARWGGNDRWAKEGIHTYDGRMTARTFRDRFLWGAQPVYDIWGRVMGKDIAPLVPAQPFIGILAAFAWMLIGIGLFLPAAVAAGLYKGFFVKPDSAGATKKPTAKGMVA